MEYRDYSAGDRIEAREVIRWKGEQGTRVNNGTRGTIETIDQNAMLVQWDDGRKTTFTNAQARLVDFSYARTTHKQQSATNKFELLMVSLTGSKIFNRESSYVGATRGRLNTEVFTADQEKMLKNAGADVSKTTALTRTDLGALVKQGRELDQAFQKEKQAAPKVRRVQELTRD